MMLAQYDPDVPLWHVQTQTWHICCCLVVAGTVGLLQHRVRAWKVKQPDIFSSFLPVLAVSRIHWEVALEGSTERLKDFPHQTLLTAHRLYSHRVAKTQWWLTWEGRKREVTNTSSNMLQLVLYKTSVCNCKCNAIHFHQACQMNSLCNEQCERFPTRSQNEVS